MSPRIPRHRSVPCPLPLRLLLSWLALLEYSPPCDYASIFYLNVTVFQSVLCLLQACFVCDNRVSVLVAAVVARVLLG